MRILLDENLPRKLKYRVDAKHDVLTVSERGWSGIKNGLLIQRAAAEFDVIVTMDKGIEHQQKVEETDVGFVFLHAPSNDYDDLLPLVDELNTIIPSVRPGAIAHVGESV